MSTTTDGRYLTQRLEALGVRHVFGGPGDYVLGYYDQLERSSLTVIYTADEQGAGFAADAYRSGYSLLHVHIARGDLSPALQRMTSLMAERIR